MLRAGRRADDLLEVLAPLDRRLPAVAAGRHRAVGVDRIIADLDAAYSAAPGDMSGSTMLSILRAQGAHLRPPQPVGQSGYVLRNLCLQAAELEEQAPWRAITPRSWTRSGWLPGTLPCDPPTMLCDRSP